MSDQQPHHQLTASLRVSRPAEPLSTIAPCHLCVVATLADTLKRCASQAELLTYNEVAYSFDLCISLGMLQLPVAPAPNVRL